MRTKLYGFAALVMFIFLMSYCKKKTSGGTGNPPTPVEPQTPATIGFFIDDWLPKSFTTPPNTPTAVPSGAATANVLVDVTSIISKVPNALFSHNANSWMSQMVTESSLIGHLSNLRSHITRFPGGSISDMYFWNAQPGIFPADAPTTLVDANGGNVAAGYWSGKNNDSWTISLDNYYNLLQQTSSTGMITINYGYARYGTGPNPVAAAAHMAADWVRYDNGRTKYWEIGNENYGNWEGGYRINTANNQDGQPVIVTGEVYGTHFKVFVDSMKKAAQSIGKTIYIGAVMYERTPPSWATSTERTWNTGLFLKAGTTPDFYAVHNYFTPYQQNSGATDILNSAISETQLMSEHVKGFISNAGYPLKPIAFTEWNIFAEGSMQQVSYINGIHGTMVLGESLKHALGMTARWDLANGWANGNDHGLFNIGDEPGGVPKWNPRPSFYYMYYFRKMIGDRLVMSIVNNTADIIAYASSFSSGHKGVIIVNKSTSAHTINVTFPGATVGAKYYYYRLTGGTETEFSRKVLVNGSTTTGIAGGPADYATLQAYSSNTADGIKFAAPARSVCFVVVE